MILPNPSPSQDETASRAERDLYRIMVTATALGFGTLAAFLVSLRDIAKDVSFEFSVWTIVAFLLGATAGWAFWRCLWRVIQKNRPPNE